MVAIQAASFVIDGMASFVVSIQNDERYSKQKPGCWNNIDDYQHQQTECKKRLREQWQSLTSQQASGLDKVQKKLGVGRTLFGSFSESVSVFDPEPLKQIAAELADQIPQPGRGRFDSIGKTLTAVDGSVVDTIVRVARLAWLPKAGGKMNCGYRPHRQFEIFRGNCATGSSTGPSCDGKLRLATDLLDIPAELIAEAYCLRWLIEFFLHVQTVIGLPSSAEQKAERRRNPDVHGDHCVPVDSDSHGTRTEEAYVRNNLPLYVRLGIAGRAGTAYSKTKSGKKE